MRKYYPAGSDEPHFDLTSASEKAIGWLASLTGRTFVGTESRLLTLFDLLRQMSQGSETDPETRIAELLRQRGEIDGEIERVRDGDIALIGDTAIKDRLQHFLQLARDLLADFREVEHNFRGLDRQVRERIALWDGAKGELLEEIMGQRDTIAESDQGKSFRAFWDFLMDCETLFAHQLHWGRKLQASHIELSRLTADELLLYDDLRFDRLAIGLRLEQERIGFAWVEQMVCPGDDSFQKASSTIDASTPEPAVIIPLLKYFVPGLYIQKDDSARNSRAPA